MGPDRVLWGLRESIVSHGVLWGLTRSRGPLWVETAQFWGETRRFGAFWGRSERFWGCVCEVNKIERSDIPPACFWGEKGWVWVPISALSPILQPL